MLTLSYLKKELQIGGLVAFISFQAKKAGGLLFHTKFIDGELVYNAINGT